MNKSTTLDRVIGILDEMEYEMANANFVTATLTCDYCPNTWEVDVPADWKPSGELTCEACHDEWFSWNASEDSYLDSYWESLYE